LERYISRLNLEQMEKQIDKLIASSNNQNSNKSKTPTNNKEAIKNLQKKIDFLIKL